MPHLTVDAASRRWQFRQDGTSRVRHRMNYKKSTKPFGSAVLENTPKLRGSPEKRNDRNRHQASAKIPSTRKTIGYAGLASKNDGAKSFASALEESPKTPLKPITKSLRSIVDRRYEILDCLGEGGMGAVYEVRHLRLDKRFAMKIIHPQLTKSEKTIALFHREAQALSRLDHPNCVRVIDFGSTYKGDFYLVMEKIEGQSLREIIDNGPLSLREALEITRQILMGLGHAHRAGIVHRDIKLENIIKTQGENAEFVIKIIDFGLAKIKMPKEERGPITDSGLLPGTPQYVAPETILNQVVDHQSDLYAVGVTLFRMLTAKTPWMSEDIGEILQAKVKMPIPRINRAGAGFFPKSLENFLLKSMALPEERFQTAHEMIQALDSVAGELAVSNSKMRKMAKRTFVPIAGIVGAYGKKVTASTLMHGKKLGVKISEDFRAWWKTTPSGSGNPWIGRLASGINFRSMPRYALVLVPVLLALIIRLFGPSNQGLSPEQEEAQIAEGASQENGKIGNEQEALGILSASAMSGSQEEYAGRVENQIRKKKCGKAQIEIEKVLAHKPELAHAHYLLGRALVCLNKPLQGFASFRKAIELDSKYGRCREIKEDTKTVLAIPKFRSSALEFMMDELGRAALPELIEVAEGHPDRTLRHDALQYLERAAALDRINQEKMLALDLRQAKNCDEKAKIVDELAGLGTPAAKRALRRAKNASIDRYFGKKRYVHACVRKQITRRLAEMTESSEQPEA